MTPPRPAQHWALRYEWNPRHSHCQAIHEAAARAGGRHARRACERTRRSFAMNPMKRTCTIPKLLAAISLAVSLSACAGGYYDDGYYDNGSDFYDDGYGGGSYNYYGSSYSRPSYYYYHDRDYYYQRPDYDGSFQFYWHDGR
jgi:hypothetical protein